MRMDLLAGGMLFLVVGIVLDITLTGAIIGLPMGAIGVIMMMAGFLMGGKSQTAGQQSSDEKQRRYQRYQAEGYNRHRQEMEAQERRKRKQ